MRYVSKCIPKQMRLIQPLPEIVSTERRVSEVVRQRIPGHGTGHPTAERAATMSWYEEMAAAGRSKSLTTGNIRGGGGRRQLNRAFWFGLCSPQWRSSVVKYGGRGQ